MPIATTAEATVYQLTPKPRLDEHLLPARKASATLVEVPVADIPSLLVTGTRAAPMPTWAPHVESLTGQAVDIARSAPYAVLVVPLGTWDYAVCWGHGWTMIDQARVNDSYPIDFARRRFDSHTLRSIDSMRISTRAARTTTALPANGPITDFDLDPLTSAIDGLTGTANLTHLTCDRTSSRPRKMKAGRSLKLPLGLSDADLISDLRAIEHAIATEKPADFWKLVQGISHLPANDARIPTLNSQLAEAFDRDQDGAEPAPIGYAWPAGIDVDAYAGFLMDLRTGDTPVPTEEFELDRLVAVISRIPAEDRLAELHEMRIHTVDLLTGDRLSNARAEAWLVFETELDGARYLMRAGRWYTFDDDAAERVLDQVRALIEANTIELDLPTWRRPSPADAMDENRYCVGVAARGDDFIVLDRKCIPTTLNSRLEVCDLLGPDDELIHVKWLGGSASSASHLIAQVEAAAVALHHERALVDRKVDAVVEAATEGRRRVQSLSDPTFVLAIGGRDWDADALFAMTRLQLLHVAQTIARLDGTLKFATIPWELVTAADAEAA